MKKITAAVLATLLLLLCACAKPGTSDSDSVLASTAPVADLTGALLDGTGVETAHLVSGQVSCLHDYTLSVSEMKLASQAKVAVLSGLGLEEFMQDALNRCPKIIEAGADITPLDSDEGPDPHIWLAPENMLRMTHTAAAALAEVFPQHAARIAENEAAYCAELEQLQAYGEQQLKDLACRKLITFHDGFSYFAQAFDLTVAASMEIEPGSEPSARDLEDIIALIRQENIPAIFVEANGTREAAEIVARETGVRICTLSMAMDLTGSSYQEAMRQNLDTVKEALG